MPHGYDMDISNKKKTPTERKNFLAIFEVFFFFLRNHGLSISSFFFKAQLRFRANRGVMETRLM